MDRAVEGLGSDSVEGRWPDAESDAAFELMVESVVRDCRRRAYWRPWKGNQAPTPGHWGATRLRLAVEAKEPDGRLPFTAINPRAA